MTDIHCPDCATTTPGSRFCDVCGNDKRGKGVSNSVSGTSSGAIYQAGRDINNYGAQRPEQIPMRAKWRWDSPFTQAGLAWFSTAVSIVSLLPGWKAVEPLFAMLSTGSPPIDRGTTIAWTATFLGTVVVAALGWAAFNVVRKQQILPLARTSLLPAVDGSAGKLGFTRLVGECPSCFGRLSLRNQPATWLDYADGRRRVTSWKPMVGCSRNETHVWPFDTTARAEDDD